MEHIILFFMDFSSLFPKNLEAGNIGMFESISPGLISWVNSYKCDEQTLPETNKQFICSVADYFNVHHVDFYTVLFPGKRINWKPIFPCTQNYWNIVMKKKKNY